MLDGLKVAYLNRMTEIKNRRILNTSKTRNKKPDINVSITAIDIESDAEIEYINRIYNNENRETKGKNKKNRRVVCILHV